MSCNDKIGIKKGNQGVLIWGPNQTVEMSGGTNNPSGEVRPQIRAQSGLSLDG